MKPLLVMVAACPILFVCCAAPAPVPTGPSPNATSSAYVSTATPVPMAPSQPDAGVAKASPESAAGAFPITPDQSRKAAEPVWRYLLPPSHVDPRLESPAPEPACDDSTCRYRLTVTVGQENDRFDVGAVHVDARTGEVLLQRFDGGIWLRTPEAFLAHARKEQAVLDAARKEPEVKKYCEFLEKNNVSCISWVEESPDVPCPPHPGFPDGCYWQVYLGENQSTHTVRFVSLHIHPETLKVVGASPMECGPMPIAMWKTYQAAKRKNPNKLPNCPNP